MITTRRGDDTSATDIVSSQEVAGTAGFEGSAVLKLLELEPHIKPISQPKLVPRNRKHWRAANERAKTLGCLGNVAARWNLRGDDLALYRACEQASNKEALQAEEHD